MDGAEKFLDFFQPDPQAGTKIETLSGSKYRSGRMPDFVGTRDDQEKFPDFTGDQTNKNRKPPINLI